MYAFNEFHKCVHPYKDYHNQDTKHLHSSEKFLHGPCNYISPTHQALATNDLLFCCYCLFKNFIWIKSQCFGNKLMLLSMLAHSFFTVEWVWYSIFLCMCTNFLSILCVKQNCAKFQRNKVEKNQTEWNRKIFVTCVIIIPQYKMTVQLIVTLSSLIN